MNEIETELVDLFIKFIEDLEYYEFEDINGVQNYYDEELGFEPIAVYLETLLYELGWFRRKESFYEYLREIAWKYKDSFPVKLQKNFYFKFDWSYDNGEWVLKVYNPKS